jgi:hypothetical protein
MPASGLIGIRMVIIGIRLQTWMRVIVDVDVYVRLSLEIYGSWQADYIEWPLPGQGHVPPLHKSCNDADEEVDEYTSQANDRSMQNVEH